MVIVKIKYPSMEEVENANIRQLCVWTRFLESPGFGAIGMDSFEATMSQDGLIMDRILARQKELGGWTPELSKSIGWN